MNKRKYNPIRQLRVKKTDDLKSIYARVKRAFTAADLQQYTEKEEGVSAEEVVKELQALAKAGPARSKEDLIMTVANGNGQQFQVHCSGMVARRLKEIQKAASPVARKQIADAFQRIVRELRINPFQVGEPLYRLPELKLQVRTVVLGPLAITFAVSEEKPHVFIKNGSKLAGP